MIPTEREITLVQPAATEREEDIREKRERTRFTEEGCGCSKECWREFQLSHILLVRDSFLEMTTKEKEMVVMGEIMANTRTGETTFPNKRKEKERVKDYTVYYHGGVKVLQ